MKSKKLANILVYSVILIFILTIGWNLLFGVGHDLSVDDYIGTQEAAETMAVSQGEESKVGSEELLLESTNEIISVVHAELNQLVGWNRYRGFSWKRNEERLETLMTDLKPLVEGGSDQAIKKDAYNTVLSINRAIEKRDTNGILLAHRIMHDLDYLINGNVADGIKYNVTEYKGGD